MNHKIFLSAAVAAWMSVCPVRAEEMPPCGVAGACEPVEVSPPGDPAAEPEAYADLVAQEEPEFLYAESDPVFDTEAIFPDLPADYSESDPIFDREVLSGPDALA